jgi:hypothetical protein
MCKLLERTTKNHRCTTVLQTHTVDFTADFSIETEANSGTTGRKHPENRFFMGRSLQTGRICNTAVIARATDARFLIQLTPELTV